MARATGLEPATSGVTGRRSNQLNYARVLASLAGARLDVVHLRVNENGYRTAGIFAWSFRGLAPVGKMAADALPDEPHTSSGVASKRRVVGDDGLEPPTPSV